MLTARCRARCTEHEVEFISPCGFPVCAHECREVLLKLIAGIMRSDSRSSSLPEHLESVLIRVNPLNSHLLVRVNILIMVMLDYVGARS
jgi:hypothetical protein